MEITTESQLPVIALNKLSSRSLTDFGQEYRVCSNTTAKIGFLRHSHYDKDFIE